MFDITPPQRTITPLPPPLPIGLLPANPPITPVVLPTPPPAPPAAPKLASAPLLSSTTPSFLPVQPPTSATSAPSLVARPFPTPSQAGQPVVKQDLAAATATMTATATATTDAADASRKRMAPTSEELRQRETELKRQRFADMAADVTQLQRPDYITPFTTREDVWKRLAPFRLYPRPSNHFEDPAEWRKRYDSSIPAMRDRLGHIAKQTPFVLPISMLSDDLRVLTERIYLKSSEEMKKQTS